ncbi:MAG: penicillin-insensitive murein endopeptidase [Minicystis sp.]
MTTPIACCDGPRPDVRCEDGYLVGADGPDVHVSDHFRFGELFGPGDTVRLHGTLVRAAEELRVLLGKPLSVERNPGAIPPDCDASTGAGAAHAGGDALHLVSSEADIRRAAALALFGAVESADASSGPFAPFHAFVYRAGGKCRFHAHRAAPDEAVQRLSRVGAHTWRHLHARLSPADYLLFKRDGHPSYARQWGRPELVDLLVQLAVRYRDETGVPLAIGDMSHVLGGPMDDHASHAAGVDADVYVLDYPDGPDQSPRHYWVVGAGQGPYHYRRAVDDAGSAASAEVEQRLKERTRVLCEILAEQQGLVAVVGHDHEVFGRFPSSHFLDATTVAARGWPPHQDHIHIRIAA